MFGTFNLIQTGNYHVKGSGIFSRTDSPYMQVMPAFHSLCLTDFLLQFVEVNVLRHGIQCKVETLFQEFPGRNQDNEGYAHSDERIECVIMGQADKDARDNYPDGYQCIHGHVQKSSFDV